MRESSKAALGGIVSALAVIAMLVTYLSPLLVYTAPPLAGILLILIVNEIGYRWAFGTYVSISLLSVFLIADKESAVFYKDCPEEFDSLFEVLISKDKALEINTSSIDKQIAKGSSYIMPDPDIIRRYIAMGGKLITIGSDAHKSDRIGLHFEKTAKYLKSLGVNELFYFAGRKPVSDSEYSAFF